PFRESLARIDAMKAADQKWSAPDVRDDYEARLNQHGCFARNIFSRSKSADRVFQQKVDYIHKVSQPLLQASVLDAEEPAFRSAEMMMRRPSWLNSLALTAAAAGLSLIAIANAPGDASGQLINVSYDPTRELYQELNSIFVDAYQKEAGRLITIVQLHGGSSSQARRVVSGEIKADVVTLGLYSDVDSLRKRGLIAENWASRLPNHSSPYASTIVFVVRHGNPRQVKDWPDLLQPKLEIVTPDPRSSGNGKLAALAAWAAVVTRGGSEADARLYLRELYRHAPSLAEGARGAAIDFAKGELGDVHLTWENEAIRE